MDELGSSRTSRRTFVVLAGMVVLVLVAVVVAVAVRRQHSRKTLTDGPAVSTKIVSTPAPESSLPAPPAGFSADEFRMAAPPLSLVIGPVSPLARRCHTDQIKAVAATRRTADGVLGVVHLQGTARVKSRFGGRQPCSLPIARGPTRLLAAGGTALPVPRRAGDRTVPPDNQRSDIPLAAGNAAWGFAWYGSWCGPPAAAVEVPLRGGKTVRAPFHGPQPRCAEHAGSVLIDGVAGNPDEPVQAARPAYADLRLTASMARRTTRFELAPIRMTLRTVGAEAVPLDPCPSYGGDYYARARSGGFGTGLASGYLPCTQRMGSVRPGHPLHFTIPATALDRDAKRGSVINVRAGVAGVPVVQLAPVVH